MNRLAIKCESSVNQAPAREAAEDSHGPEVLLTGAVGFAARLHCEDGELFLETTEHPSTGERLRVFTSFTKPASFDAWCAEDPIRFAQPLVHRELLRIAANLWQTDA